MKLILYSILLVFLVLFIFTNPLHSEDKLFKWRKTYNDSKYAAIFKLADIKFDDKGNKFVLGSEIQGADDYNMVLVVCNSTGDTILNCVYKDPSLPQARDIAEKLHFDSDGNIIVIGSSCGDLDFSSTVVLKYDLAGTLLWECKYNITEGFEHHVMESYLDDADNLQLLMQNSSIESYRLVTVSPDGKASFPLNISLPDDVFFRLKFDIHHNSILRFSSAEVQKYNLKGEKLWENKELYKKDIMVADCVIDHNGDVLLVGIKQIPYTNNCLYKIVKYSASGEFLWETEHASTAREVSFRNFLTTGNGDLVGVYQECSENFDGRIHVVRFSKGGTFINEFSLTNSWGKWKEIDEIILTRNDHLFYAARNCEHMPSDDNGKQQIEVGLVCLDGTVVWNQEIVTPPDTSYASVFLTENSFGGLGLILKQEIYREGKVFKPKDVEYVHKQFDVAGYQFFQQTHRGEGFSELEPMKIIKGDNHFFVFAETSVAGVRKEFVVLKYDTKGNLLSETHHADEYLMNLELKSVGATKNGGIKVLYKGYVKNENGSYEQKYKALTFNSEGVACATTNLDIGGYDYGVVSFLDGSYGVLYYLTDKMLFHCFTSEDEFAWEKNLSDDSFLKDAKIAGIDQNDNIYFFSGQRLVKLNNKGIKIWECIIPVGEIRLGGVKNYSDGKILFWFDEKELYHFNKTSVCRISNDGLLEWYTCTKTLQHGLDVVPLKGGGAAFLGQLSDNLYSRFDNLPSLVTLDDKGVELAKRTDLPYDLGQLVFNAGYYIKQVSAGEDFYLSTGNTIMKFDEFANYKGYVKHRTSSSQVSSLKVGDLELFSDDLILTASLRGKELDYTSWSVIDNYCYSSTGIDNLINRAPEFVVDSSSIGDLSVKPIAIDPDGDAIIYSSVGENSKLFDIYPKTGHIRDIFFGRGLHPVVLRATDTHGAYADLKYIYKKGPDAAPMFCSAPITNCRGGSKYTYEMCVHDDEADVFTFAFVDHVPDWLTIDPSRGILTGVPPVSDIGKSYRVRILVHEELFDHKIYQEFDLFVGAENIGPNFESSPVLKAELNQQYSYQVHAVDPENDDLKYDIVKKPYWLKWDKDQLLFYGKPNKEDLFYRNNNVEIMVSDCYDASARQVFDIELWNSVNQPPEFIDEPIIQAYVGISYFYIPILEDEDVGKLHFTLLAAPSFLNYSYKGVFGIPQEGDVGSHPVRIMATDEYGLSATQNYTLKVGKSLVEPTNIMIKLNSEDAMLSVNVSGDTNPDSATIMIINDSNQKVFHQDKLEWVDLNLDLSIDISSWNSGKYFINYRDANKSAFKMFLID